MTSHGNIFVPEKKKPWYILNQTGTLYNKYKFQLVLFHEQEDTHFQIISCKHLL